MQTINLYRVWCPVEDEWAEVWGNTAPTVSPLHAGNPVDPSHTSIINTITQLFPTSDIGTKVWVHSSPKPQPNNGTDFSIYWTGAGDDIENHTCGDGVTTDLQVPANTTGVPVITTKDIEFDPVFGDVYLHNGLVSWTGVSGIGNNMSVEVIGEESKFQPYVNLIGEIKDHVFIPSTTPTHGFAAAPTLISSRKKTGWWDYNTATGLLPNMQQTGAFNIKDIEVIVSRFINKLYMYESSSEYVSLGSTDSTLLPPGYFLRFVITNNSPTDWSAHVLMQLFRETTV